MENKNLQILLCRASHERHDFPNHRGSLLTALPFVSASPTKGCKAESVSTSWRHFENYLTRLPLVKMAANLADDIECIFLNENDRILIKISL